MGRMEGDLGWGWAVVSVGRKGFGLGRGEGEVGRGDLGWGRLVVSVIGGGLGWRGAVVSREEEDLGGEGRCKRGFGLGRMVFNEGWGI